jgi:tetratricopeptide (TPR) repeat protein
VNAERARRVVRSVVRFVEGLTCPRAMGLVFALAFVLRVVFLLQLRAHSPTYFAPEGGDSILYDRLASGAVDTRAYFHSPLYIWWLSGIYGLAGRNLTLVRVLQHTLGAANAALLTGITWQLTRSRWAALMAGLAAACFARAIFLEGQLLIDGILPILLSGCGALALHYDARPGPRRALALGLGLGVVTLARASALVWWPVMMGWLFAKRRNSPWRGPALALTLGVALTILPVTLRNYVAERDLVLVTANGGLNLFVGNNPRATGGYSLPAGLWFRPGDPDGDFRGEKVAEAALGHPAKSSEISTWWGHRAIEYMWQHPGHAATLLARRLRILVSNEEFEQLYLLNAYAEFCPVLRWLWPAAPILVLGLFGIIVAMRAGGGQRLWAVLVVTHAAAFLPFFVVDRYRMPWAVFLTPMAGLAIATLLQLIRLRRWRSCGAWLGATAIATVLCLAPAGYPSNRWWQYTAFGDAALANSKPRAAIHWYERALGIDETMLWARTNLAIARMRVRDWRGAEADLLIAESWWPNDARVKNELGVLCLRQERFAEAEAYLHAALAISPMLAEAQANLAETLLAEERFDEADRAFREAIALARASSHESDAWVARLRARFAEPR